MDKMVCKCEEDDSSKRYAFRREGEGGFSGNNPIFSHQHYMDIGELFKKMEKNIKTDEDFECFTDTINQFIGLFKNDNSKFDENRFIDFVKGKRKN